MKCCIKRSIRESRGDYMETKAYQELTTYAGTTIVENDADCYMEVSAGGGDVLRAKKLALLLGRLIIGRVLLLLYNCSGRRKKT